MPIEICFLNLEINIQNLIRNQYSPSIFPHFFSLYIFWLKDNILFLVNYPPITILAVEEAGRGSYQIMRISPENVKNDFDPRIHISNA